MRQVGRSGHPQPPPMAKGVNINNQQQMVTVHREGSQSNPDTGHPVRGLIISKEENPIYSVVNQLIPFPWRVIPHLPALMQTNYLSTVHACNSPFVVNVAIAYGPSKLSAIYRVVSTDCRRKMYGSFEMLFSSGPIYYTSGTHYPSIVMSCRTFPN